MGLRTVELIRKRVEERPAELAEARRGGRKVAGWQGYYVPEELIYALDLIPVRIGAGGDDRLVEIGARYSAVKSCGTVRDTAGLYAESKDSLVQNTDFLVFDATCLQTRRTADILKHYFHKEIVTLGVPRNVYWPEAKAYFSKEAEHFAGRLEELSGKHLDEGKVAEAVELYNKTRGAIAKLYSYQSARSPMISWEETYDVIHAGFSLDRKEYLALLERLLEEIEGGQRTSAIQADDDEARIFITGSVVPPDDKLLIEIINGVGGRIVADDLWSGQIPYLDVHIRQATVEGIASAYIERTPHGALPNFELEPDKRVKRLKELVRGSGAQGVIYHTLRYNDPYSFQGQEIKDALAAAGIPLLEVQTEYAGTNYEAIRVQAEAFVEMLKSRALAG